jgi:hypothetical protein
MELPTELGAALNILAEYGVRNLCLRESSSGDVAVSVLFHDGNMMTFTHNDFESESTRSVVERELEYHDHLWRKT